MQLSDLTVEVRNKSLNRVGVIRPEDMNLTIVDLYCNVGTWTLKLPEEHVLVPALSSSGAGIIITGPDGKELFSGPVDSPQSDTSSDDPGGTVTFTGESDNHVLSDMLSLPDPASASMEVQNKAHDTRTGPAETLMHDYVRYNVGPNAVPDRNRGIVMGANGARGDVLTKNPRFQVLGDLLNELSVVSNIGFRIVQRGDLRTFETYPITDRSAEIRLDVENGSLASAKFAKTVPGVTRVLVAGQGDLTERQLLYADTPESLAAEVEWNRRIERFVDQRQTDQMSDLQQAADELLAEQGFTAYTFAVVPADDTETSMRFGIDYYLGDRVTVVIDGAELEADVVGMALAINNEGIRLAVQVGDPYLFGGDTTIRTVKDIENRVSQLERNTSSGNLTAVGLKAGPNGTYRVEVDGSEASVRFADPTHTYQDGKVAGGDRSLTMQHSMGAASEAHSEVSVDPTKARLKATANGASPASCTFDVTPNGPVSGKPVALLSETWRNVSNLGTGVAAGTGNDLPQYRKDASGNVFCVGRLTLPAGIVSGTVIATLGFAPTRYLPGFQVAASGGSTPSATLDIDTSGQVIYNRASGAASSNTAVYLTGLNFPTF